MQRQNYDDTPNNRFNPIRSSLAPVAHGLNLKVTLEPNNCDFEPIELTCEEEENVRVVAELVEVLG